MNKVHIASIPKNRTHRSRKQLQRTQKITIDHAYDANQKHKAILQHKIQASSHTPMMLIKYRISNQKLGYRASNLFQPP